ncbi:MAG: hypothetical protein KC609_05080 [Myxococcales bacterium]|nr:hypothetical protein [Myxococcales bacterium]
MSGGILVSFSVDADALRASELPLPLRIATHRRLLDCWQRYGVLVLFGPSLEESAVFSALTDLPQALRKRWQELLKRGRRRVASPRNGDPSRVESLAELAPLARGVELFCFDEVRAHVLGVPEDAFSIALDDGAVEICRFDCADQAEAFRRAERLGEREIEAQSLVANVWSERFAPLLEHSRTLTVVDRYALKGLVDRPDGQSGLRRLLTEIDAGDRARQLTLFSASQVDYSHSALLGAIDDRVKACRRGGLREVKLYLSDDRSFGRIAHYRYLRFDQTLCQLDVGLDVLAGREVYRTCTFRLTSLSDVVRSEETALRESAQLFVFTPR